MKKNSISLLIVLSFILSFVCSLNIFVLGQTELLCYDFETENEGWEYWSKLSSEKYTYTVTDASCSGNSALLIRDILKNDAAGIQSPYFNITPGGTYTFLVSSYVIKNKVSMYLRFYDASKVQLCSESLTFSQQVWEEKAITYTAPENSVYAKIIVCTTSTDISGAYIDNIKVVEGTQAAAGNVDGKIPDELPLIEEGVVDCEIFDDGYADGELIYSQSFESGIDDWTIYNTTSYNIENKNATDGLNSVYVSDTSDTLSEGIHSSEIEVAQGNKYTVYIDVFNIKSGFSLYLHFYNSGNTLLSQPYTGLSSSGWKYGRISAFAPEGATGMEICILGGATGTAEAYFDNVRVYKGEAIVKPEESAYVVPEQAEAVESQIISVQDNKLKYNAYNDEGDTLSDFSYAGFYEGRVALPVTENLPVASVLSPSGTDDDTAFIQTAIDNAASQDGSIGMRVVKLKAGRYYINETGLKLKSGVLLSGEGQGPSGTILHSVSETTGNVIEADGGYISRTSSMVNITDSYIKSGSKSITVEDASEFSAGDLIYIVHPSTAEWIEALKMSNVTNVYGNSISWNVNEHDIKTSRVITKISGNEIYFENGLFIPYDKTYAQSYIYKADDSLLIHDAGVENLRVTSQFSGDPYDNKHSKTAIYVKRTKNMFVRNVTAKNMYNGVFGCRAHSRQITVQNCSSLDPVSTIEGGNRYPFYADVDTEKILFTGCYSYDGRHDYMVAKGSSGPVVFSDSVADMSNACSETHANFATGVLFENIYQITDRSAGFIGFPNRGYYGTDTPQGWTAAGCVAWNVLSNSIIVNKPLLTYNNFAVGVWGIYNTENSNIIKNQQIEDYRYNAYRYSGIDSGPESAFATKDGTPMVGDAYKEAEFTPVNPRSLFKAQLSQRLTGTIDNAKPNAPIIIYPRPDKEVSQYDNAISINGIYEKGASAVYVYVDDVKYQAALNSENKFDITVTLTEGIHKIYATQVVADVEGGKTPDRFIIIGEDVTGNTSYLESNYSADMMNLIADDRMMTYDEYLADLEYLDVVEFEGDGTDESPYIIDSYLKFEAVLRNGAQNPKDAVYLLTGFDETPLELSDSYKPLGVAFSGKLIGGDMIDGKIEEKIQLISFNTETGGSMEGVDYITSTNSNDVQGIIFHELNSAIVKNLKLTGSVEMLCGSAFFGTLAGHAYNSTISNVHNYASIESSQAKGIGGIIGWAENNTVISKCSNHGNISVAYGTTVSPDVGGITGNMTSTRVVYTCNYGDIQGRDNAGGISGYSNCNISKCGNFGNISATYGEFYGYAGGITGRTNGGSVSECFNTGEITSVKYAGGIMGFIKSEKNSNVTNSFNLGKISGEEGTGLAVGGNFGTCTISGFYDVGNNDVRTYAAYNLNPATIKDAFVFSGKEASATETELRAVGGGFIKNLPLNTEAFSDTDIWFFTENYPYPNLKNNPLDLKSLGIMGDGTYEDPFRIYFKEDLEKINERPDAYFVQMADISDVSEMLCTEASFSGVYNGNNLNINVSIDKTTDNSDEKYIGLFARASGTIKNLNIYGYVKAGNIESDGGVAAFVGRAESGLNITDLRNYATVISKGDNTAGIVGNNSSWAITVARCINYGDITADTKASGIIGTLASSSSLQECGNYGNITGGQRASGISSCVYAWRTLVNNFNTGTIRATGEDGIACGLFSDLITAKNGKNISQSFNAGNLYGETTFGICNIGDSGANTVSIQNCYNGVYADYPITSATEYNTPVISECYYLSGSEADEFAGTTHINRDELKEKTMTGFSLSGDYLYPQIISNTLDDERDNIDFSYVKLENGCINSSVSVEGYEAEDFYITEGTYITLNIKPGEHFYSVDICNGDLTIESDITENKAIEICIDKDMILSVSDKIIEIDDSQRLISTAEAFVSDGNEAITVDGTEYRKYVLIASKIPAFPGLKLVEFGIYEDTASGITKGKYKHKFTAEYDRILPTGAFGILLYNDESKGNGMIVGKSYYTMPYALYVDGYGKEYIITGPEKMFVYNE